MKTDEQKTPTRGSDLPPLRLTVEEVLEFERAWMVPWTENTLDLRARCERFPFERHTLERVLREQWRCATLEEIAFEVDQCRHRWVKDPHTILFAHNNDCLYVTEVYDDCVYHLRRVSLLFPKTSPDYN